MESYSAWVGKRLEELPTPSLIVDRSVVKRNCKQMLSICDALGVIFRAHVKTHKTAELMALMTAADTRAEEHPYISLIVSTTLEAFHLVPSLEAARLAGKRVNILYGVPLPVSRLPDLVRLMDRLGPGSVTLMIDHPMQLDAIREAAQSASASFRPSLFVKIDTGYGRAGVPSNTQSTALRAVCEKVARLQSEGLVKMLGFYSHGGDSYSVDDAPSAFGILARELSGLTAILPVAEATGLRPGVEKGFVLSVGATPTVKSAWLASADLDSYKDSEAAKLIRDAKERGDIVEFHAGNYPMLDMQQFATNAGLSSTVSPREQIEANMPSTGLEDIGLSILTEVNSIYEERETKECLITAGCLALGREPCKSYSGWGVVSDWPRPEGLRRGSGWLVHSISQEHGKIRRGDVPGVKVQMDSVREFTVGQRMRVWPNHACIASANFPAYFVVDQDDDTGGDVVREVWLRCRGW